jgi:tetratricopeptide (TPR) repeat protein
MERRFAVHAGGDPQALIGRNPRRRAWTLAIALVCIASSAGAAPKRRDAKAAFDRGLAAYKKGSFEAASKALGKSFALERDVDTLFAWAQSERQLERCDKAIDLYEKLLGFDLPPANREAVELKRTECRTIIAQQKPAGEPPTGTPTAEPPGDAPTGDPPGDAPTGEPPMGESPAGEPPPGADPMAASPALQPVTDTPPAARAWYRDPIALGLVGTGVIATGAGAGLLISARSLDQGIGDKSKTPTYEDAQKHVDQAKSRGNLGLITAGVGGALVIGGVVWIVTHRGGTEQHMVTGWLAPGGGGLAVAGGF